MPQMIESTNKELDRLAAWLYMYWAEQEWLAANRNPLEELFK